MSSKRRNGDRPEVGHTGSCLGERKWLPFSKRCANCETHIGTDKPCGYERRNGCIGALGHLTIQEKQDLKRQKEQESDGTTIRIAAGTFFYQAPTIDTGVSEQQRRSKRSRRGSSSSSTSSTAAPTSPTTTGTTTHTGGLQHLVASPNFAINNQRLLVLKSQLKKEI